MTDAGGPGEMKGERAIENLVLGCRYGQMCVFFARQSNESVDQPERT